MPPRKIDVSVAVAFEPELGFFLSYNQRWHGYAFPMRKRRMTDPDLAAGALAALRDATELPLRGATVSPLAALEVQGESSRTGEPTLYRYHAFDVQVAPDLSGQVVPHGFGCRCGFLKPHDIAPPGAESPEEEKGAVFMPAAADLVTWSTRRIVEELIGNQRVAIAAICRRGAAGPEYLMNRNANYRGYFPIAARCRHDAQPKFEVREAVREDSGYRPWVTIGNPEPAVTNSHFSPRFQCERRFVYLAFPVSPPARIRLDQPDNEFEESLARSGLLWRWVPDDALDDPAAHDLSPTIPVIREALRKCAARLGGA
jgi:hypothetical protein